MKNVGKNIVATLLLFAAVATETDAQVFNIDAETASYIDAATYNNATSTVLFFNETNIMVYDVTSEAKVEGAWYDLGSELGYIDAAVALDDDHVFLFNGNHYVTFEVSTATIIDDWQEMTGFPAEWNGNIDAAVRWNDDEIMFFHGSDYVIYSLSQAEYTTWDEYTSWEGWPEDWEPGLEAVLNIGGNVYFMNEGEVVMLSAETGELSTKTTAGM